MLKALVKVNVVDSSIPSSFRIKDAIAVAAFGKANKKGLLSFNNARYFLLKCMVFGASVHNRTVQYSADHIDILITYRDWRIMIAR